MPAQPLCSALRGLGGRAKPTLPELSSVRKLPMSRDEWLAWHAYW